MQGFSESLAISLYQTQGAGSATLSSSFLSSQQLLQTQAPAAVAHACLQPVPREGARTFHSDFFDLFGFLIHPLLPPDFLSCTHHFFQFLNLLFRSKEETFRDKQGEKILVILAAGPLRREMQARDSLSCAESLAQHQPATYSQSKEAVICSASVLSPLPWDEDAAALQTFSMEEKSKPLWNNLAGQDVRASTERREDLGLQMVLVCKAAYLSAHEGSCVKILPSPDFPVPGKTLQEDRPTPTTTQNSSETQRLHRATALTSPSACYLPPHRPLQQNSWKKHQALLPMELFRAFPSAKAG